MKKLKLSLDQLQVTSFVAQNERDGTGTVNGLQISHEYYASGCMQCNQSRLETQCDLDCTRADGCYPSLYCSDIGPGLPNNTCADGCMTDNYAAC